MQTTRRAQHDWLRETARDLRAGRVAPALDKLRSNGAIHAFAKQDEAKEYLVRSYVASIEKTVTEQGKERQREAILLADTNADMNAMNEMVQERLGAAGRLGAAEQYTTNFGAANFRENDLLAIREGKDCARKSKWVNGDRARVIAHLGDGRLQLQRERDGAIDTWDPREHGAIQLGYAMTSYRSQGKTVDDVFLLPAQSRRGTYVDVTRARDSVTIAYGEDKVRDFGALMYAAQRDQGKTLVRDAQRAVDAREQSREAERQRAIARTAKTPTKSRSHDGTGRELRHERGHGPDLQR
jgi:ATP-dependent exoDNAse (exonuclease V) alpha subunit